MSLPIKVTDLLSQRTVESSRIEYKAAWNPKPILQTICAFANDMDNCGGGYIVIGVEEENGQPVLPVRGVEPESLDRIQKELLQKCNLIEPRYLPVVEVTEVDGKALIVIWAYGGEMRPYKCPLEFPSVRTHHGEKGYFIRKMSNTIRTNANEERELVLLTGRTPFDDQMNRRAELSDLRNGLIADFLYSVGSELYATCMRRPIRELGEDLRIVDGTTEYCKPVNVGLMFFNEDPERFFREAHIEVVDKPEPTGENLQEQYFKGPLDKQLRDALQYIRNYMLRRKIVKVEGQAEALHHWNYPYRAVEEALANAVYHKAYDIAEPITVTLTPEHLEILSVPGPDRSISDEDLRRCRLVSKRYRNRRIGNFLKELQLAEGRNTGVPAIVEAMRRNGSELPRFETDEERSYFSVILPVHPAFRPGGAPPTVAETMQAQAQNEMPPMPAARRRTPGEIRKMVLQRLEEDGPMSSRQLADRLGYAKLNGTLSHILRTLILEGIVRWSNPDQPHTPNQLLILNGMP